MKESNLFSRRQWLQTLGASGAALAAGPYAKGFGPDPQTSGITGAFNTPDNQAERMAWWHEARFGMFIHFGLYSVLARHEWAMEMEGIPVLEYMKLAKQFNPHPHAARAWASLAKQAGMKYMVMTTKHHEGFCNFNTSHTTYCAPKQAAGRDLVKEYVDAAREQGLHVGFYYSLMDWHHPDGARCATDEAARQRFVAYTHGLIREIMSHYGPIDVLWYDVDWPLTAQGWESEKMNRMVFNLQPKIIVNNRNGLPGDFSTPEQHIQAAQKGRAWEACMTMNDSWGYQRADDNWKSAKTIVRNLIQCSHGGGNYLLNIGPKGDGSIPEESVKALTTTGEWMKKYGSTIYGSDPCQVSRSVYAGFTRKGNTLYMHVYFWPGNYVAISGLMTKVKSARYLATGENINFQQTDFQLKLTGLPVQPPDEPATVLAIECEAEPVQNTLYVRENRPRDGV